MTQEMAVLKYIEDFGSITSMEAFSELGITRLSDRIFTLRNKGYDIETIKMKMTNRYGHCVNYAKYKLGDKND